MSPSYESASLLHRTEAIFHEALAVPAEERTSLLESRCAGDTALMEELRSLIAACEAEHLSTLNFAREAESKLDVSTQNRLIGPYQLDRLLGRGGMGAVYLAHRSDGQFSQQVAIKLIDLPLATGLFRERFRMERQILAGLAHPYIARLLDGGVTDDGDLYLAMEYVVGINISQYCQKHRLSLRDRLLLFKHVCEAVQFAHQNLVVHRDLKPDNILVVDDGTPRLLDFGTAKLLAPTPVDAASEFTQQGLRSFTPQYASPEQVLGDIITTASDIYSLGMLLYLMLAGTPAYQLQEFTTAEMLRVICKEQPPRPSAAASALTEPIYTEPLDADLDAIVLKALRKEPQGRYATVDQFAADIHAWLDNRPVMARRGTLRYRANKFIRRNSLAFAAATLLFATILAGVAGILWQSRVANLERRRAEARSEDLRQLSNSLLSELDDALKDIPGSTGAQKLLVSRVLEHLDRMAADAHGDRQTELDLITAYTRLGNVQGNIYDQNIADTPGALVSFGKALALAKPLAESHPSDKDVLRAYANVLEDRGELLSQWGTPQDSVDSLQAAVQTYDRLIALPGVTSTLVLAASTANQTLGDELCQDTGLGDAAAGIAAYRRSLAMDVQALKLDASSVRAQSSISSIHMHIGNAQLDDNPAEALKEFQASLKMLDALPSAERSRLPVIRLRAIIVRKEAVALSELGEYAKAVPLFHQAVAVFERLSQADRNDVRALGDMKRVLDDEASSFEYAADPTSLLSPDDKLRNMRTAEQLLQQEASTIKHIMQQDQHEDWKPELASVQTRINALQQMLHQSGDSDVSTRDALAVLKSFAAMQQASLRNIDLAVTGFLRARPVSVENSKLAVDLAQHSVALTHRKSATSFLELAQAYQADGRSDEAVAAATAGLALLAPAPAQGHTFQGRKLLDIKAPQHDPNSRRF